MPKKGRFSDRTFFQSSFEDAFLLCIEIRQCVFFYIPLFTKRLFYLCLWNIYLFLLCHVFIDMFFVLMDFFFSCVSGLLVFAYDFGYLWSACFFICLWISYFPYVYWRHVFSIYLCYLWNICFSHLFIKSNKFRLSLSILNEFPDFFNRHLVSV